VDNEHSASSTKTPNKGGRPRKHEDGLAPAVSFRLPKAERAIWDEKVAASGLTASEFFRELVLKNRTQVVARARPNADAKRMLYLFNKASNNMNQLAHRANQDHRAGLVSESTYAGILAELSELRRLMLADIER
jgi:hypothetical protein